MCRDNVANTSETKIKIFAGVRRRGGAVPTPTPTPGSWSTPTPAPTPNLTPGLMALNPRPIKRSNDKIEKLIKEYATEKVSSCCHSCTNVSSGSWQTAIFQKMYPKNYFWPAITGSNCNKRSGVGVQVAWSTPTPTPGSLPRLRATPTPIPHSCVRLFMVYPVHLV